jgi:DNA polymerase I-like protein with 3'-5' exonuclease and polymerase domains
LYASIPGFKALVERVARAAQKGWLLGLDGRKLWIRRTYSGLNTLIQGGGAICMKTIAVELDKLAREHELKSFKVIDMHDEGQWEAYRDEIESLERYIADSFMRTSSLYSLRCPLEADIKVGKNWSETH